MLLSLFLLLSLATSTEQSIEKKDTTNLKVTSRPAPAQEKLSEQLANMKTQFFALQSLENTGTSLVNSTQVSLLKRKIIQAEKDQKRLEGKAKSSKVYRDRKKEEILKLRLVLNI